MNKDNSMPDRNYVAHGSEWAEHEDYLVGNIQGLKRLKESIDQALENGESNIGAGEFVGVKCLVDEFFESQTDEAGGNLRGILFIAALIAIGIVFLEGRGVLEKGQI